MTSKFISRRALTPQQIYAIGFVAAEWSNLEFAMMIAIGELLGLAPAPAASLASLFGGVNTITDALIRISRELDAWHPIAENLEAICKKINDLAGERNNIVHANWDLNVLRDPVTNELTIGHHPTASGTGFRRRGKNAAKSFTFTAAEMRQVAVASHEATVALMHLIWKQSPPWPSTPTLSLVLARQAKRNGLQLPSRPIIKRRHSPKI